MKRALIQGTRICQIIDPATEDQFPVAPGLQWVNVADDTTAQDKYINSEVVKFQAPPLTVDDIQDEAERRINKGTVINGVQFKCDDQSTNRLEGMHGRFVRAEAASESYSATFRTESGAEVTITSAAQAQAILDAAIDYVALILSKSAALQAMDPIPANYTDNSHWTDE